MVDLTDLFEQHEIWWAVRITVDELTLDKTCSLFDQYSKYIVSEEGDGFNTRIHHHILLVTQENAEDIKKKIRDVYPTATGNKCIYCKPCRDKRKLKKYTLKEGNYKYKGFDSQKISDAFKTSVKKTDLKAEVVFNEDQLILGKITFQKFVEKYVDIKVTHDQPLYQNHIEAYVTKVGIRANVLSKSDYSRNIVNRVQEKCYVHF